MRHGAPATVLGLINQAPTTPRAHANAAHTKNRRRNRACTAAQNTPSQRRKRCGRSGEDGLWLNALAGVDVAEAVDALASLLQQAGGGIGILRGADEHHADAAVEDAVHLGGVDLSGFLQPAEQRRQRPGLSVEAGGEGVGQDARDVAGQAAAGDVRQPFDEGGMLAFEGEQRAHVKPRGGDDRLTQGGAAIKGSVKVRAGAVENLADERVAIGMRAAGCQPQHNVSGTNAAAVDDFVFFHDADGKSGQVIFAFRIHAGHLGSLAANQRAARKLAALGNTGDDGSGGVLREFAAGEIVEEKQGFGALHEDVVDAHGNEVLPDGVVHIPFKGQTQFGADAVRAGNQHRLAVLAEGEERAKAADSGQHFRAHGAFGERFDAFDEGIACVDIDSGVAVGKGGAQNGLRTGVTEEGGIRYLPPAKTLHSIRERR